MFLNKASNGYYYLYYHCEIAQKRKRISCKTKHKPEAIKFLSNFKTTSNKSHKQKPVSIYYIQDLSKEVLKYTSDNLQKSTSQIYKRVLNDMLRIIGNKPVKFITNKEIEHYKSIRLSEVKNTTVNIDLKTMKAIFNIALRWNWINENPMQFVKLLIISQKEKLSFSEEEVKILINNIPDITIKNIVLFALYTGCRLNEIVNVQWKDVNFAEKILLIRNKENFKTKTGKNRHIPISENLYTLLTGIFNADADKNILILHNPEDYIFVNASNTIFNKDFVSKKFKTVLRKLNFPDKFHFHCLRHTFITSLVKSGVSINYVRLIAGHSSVLTSMGYVHIVTNDLREAVNKINIA